MYAVIAYAYFAIGVNLNIVAKDIMRQRAKNTLLSWEPLNDLIRILLLPIFLVMKTIITSMLAVAQLLTGNSPNYYASIRSLKKMIGFS